MKNIHILPTKQKSIYWINSEGKLCMGCYTYGSDRVDFYITSDEQIKDGDWYLVVGGIGLATNTLHKSGGDTPKNDWLKKIILTTDPDLIKDGVQAIDDDFLNWFVKNPSCEMVEVRKIEDELISPKNPKIRFNALQDPPSFISAESLNNMILTYKYKIIIPKLEIPNPINNIREKVEELRKQETLEEYISEVTKNFKDETSIKFTSGGIKLGAKWQQEQNKNLYSEEETIEIAKNAYNEGLSSVGFSKVQFGNWFTKWFEQFKKKK